MSVNTRGIPKKPIWFITGCSTGFGRELAIYLLNLGNRVVVSARNLDKINDLSSEIKHGAEAQFLALGATNQEQVISAIQAAEAKFGHIDVLVNNAGIRSSLLSDFTVHQSLRLLGNDAVEGAKAKLKELEIEYSVWEVISCGADFPPQENV